MLKQLKILFNTIFGMQKYAIYCSKCGGVGWLFGYELDEKPERLKIDNKFTCDKCYGTGFNYE